MTMPSMEVEIDDFYQALISLDLHRCNVLHASLASRLSALQRLDLLYDVLLERLGTNWAADKIGIAQEHFGSSYVRRNLFMQLQSRCFPLKVPTARVICTTLPGEKHEGGLLIIANHFKLRGWGVYYLGTEIPMEELSRLHSRIRADVICLSFATASPLQSHLRELERLLIPVFIGGGGVGNHGTETLNGNVVVIQSRGREAVDSVVASWENRVAQSNLARLENPQIKRVY